VPVKVGNEVFPGLRSSEIHTRTPECIAGRAPFACLRETYMLRAGLFGILAQGACQTPEHGLLLGSAHVLTEAAVTLVDELPVDVAIVGLDHSPDGFSVPRGSLGNDQADVSAGLRGPWAR
jgi:hypothetical protein